MKFEREWSRGGMRDDPPEAIASCGGESGRGAAAGAIGDGEAGGMGREIYRHAAEPLLGRWKRLAEQYGDVVTVWAVRRSRDVAWSLVDAPGGTGRANGRASERRHVGVSAQRAEAAVAARG